jgi:hypothetical protein
VAGMRWAIGRDAVVTKIPAASDGENPPWQVGRHREGGEANAWGHKGTCHGRLMDRVSVGPARYGVKDFGKTLNIFHSMQNRN